MRERGRESEEGTLLLFSCLIANPNRPLLAFTSFRARSLVCPSPLAAPSSAPPSPPPRPTPPALPRPPLRPLTALPSRGRECGRGKGGWTRIRWCLCHLPDLATSLCPLSLPTFHQNKPAVFVRSSHNSTPLRVRPQPIHPVPFPLGSPLRNSPRTSTRRLMAPYAPSVDHTRLEQYLDIASTRASHFFSRPLIYSAKDTQSATINYLGFWHEAVPIQ